MKKRKVVPLYEELKRDRFRLFKPMDTWLLYCKGSFFSAVIRKRTGEWPSHVEKYMVAGHTMGSKFLFGATCIEKWLDEDLYEVEVWRDRFLTEDQRLDGARWTFKLEHGVYGGWNILMYDLDCLLDTRKFTDHFALGVIKVCSQATAWIEWRMTYLTPHPIVYYSRAGHLLKPRQVHPGDAWRYRVDHPERFGLILSTRPETRLIPKEVQE